MNVSNEKRPSNHGPGGIRLVAQTSRCSLLDEFEIDLELSDRFGSWLESRLENLVEQNFTFITPDSLRRDLRRR